VSRLVYLKLMHKECARCIESLMEVVENNYTDSEARMLADRNGRYGSICFVCNTPLFKISEDEIKKMYILNDQEEVIRVTFKIRPMHKFNNVYIEGRYILEMLGRHDIIKIYIFGNIYVIYFLSLISYLSLSSFLIIFFFF
jgi:hypothetical protein